MLTPSALRVALTAELPERRVSYYQRCNHVYVHVVHVPAHRSYCQLSKLCGLNRQAGDSTVIV